MCDFIGKIRPRSVGTCERSSHRTRDRHREKISLIWCISCIIECYSPFHRQIPFRYIKSKNEEVDPEGWPVAALSSSMVKKRFIFKSRIAIRSCLPNKYCYRWEKSTKKVEQLAIKSGPTFVHVRIFGFAIWREVTRRWGNLPYYHWCAGTL